MCKSVERGMNHASLCITGTCSCAYFEELSNDMGEWCNVLSQSCIHVLCNGVCSQPNSCDLSCLQSTLQANPGCAAQRDVLDSSRGPGGVLDLLRPLVTQDQSCEMIRPDNHAYVSCENSTQFNSQASLKPSYIKSTYKCRKSFSGITVNICWPGSVLEVTILSDC